ncbi:sensor histidine kinase [uncultured Parabacteroides sp.]|uniref:sensor histidine kinase n=1 Tax=uncultured Parabacteroides sp. TaxID=512312 RepID=UPI0025FDB98D|nr:sensor histidine kinase [uncultured Parabacteroides sp.]
MSNRLLHVSYIFTFVLFCFLNSSCKQTTSPKQIIIIQSYEAGFPAYKEIKKIFADQLQKREIQAEVHSIYLDCIKKTEKKQKMFLYEKLNTLSSLYPDIILAYDDQALNALLTCDHPSVKTTPVVFTGVNYPNLSFIQKYPNITGFHDKPDYKTNIELIEQLIGKCIVVRVTDDIYSDKIILDDMDQQIKDICKTNNIFSTEKIRLSGKNGISLPKDKKIIPDAMYISTINGKSTRSLLKGLGENYYNKAYLAVKRDYLTLSLGRFSSFPGFSVISDMIGHNYGVIGGYVTTQERQTIVAANRIADILKGAEVSDFPQITETAKKYIFDYKILDQWNISPGKLPAGSEIINIPFYVQYQPYIICIGIILGIVLLIIIIYQRILYKRENTRKKEIQENLKHEKEFMSFALESGNIFTFRYKNGVFYFDKEFYHYLGMPEKPISAEEFSNAIHADEQADFLLNRYKLDHGFPSRQITRRRYDFNKKGHEWWEFRYAQNTNIKASPTDEYSVEVNGLCLNIQQIKDTELDLTNALKKAEESDKMKSAFLANMSHEIRTPLNAIVGFSQLLGSDMELDKEEKNEFISLINTNNTLLLKLINDILDLSRIESGQISFTYADCDLSQLVDEIFNTHKLLMPDGVELIKETPKKPAIIYTDRFRLTQVVTNFINNATKFTSHGYIKVKYEYDTYNQHILLSVEDTGKGIPKDKINQVFERFQKLDEFAKGTGLGLAISLSIIKTFNGTILLESEEGKGSKFTISLPHTPQ